MTKEKSATVRTTGDGWYHLALDGVEAGLSLNDEGEMFVNVSTTEADEPTGREWPELFIMLNDAVLHAPKGFPRDVTEVAPLPDGIEKIEAYVGEDGAPVVQIDTGKESDAHERIRVHLNDSTATRWEA